MMMNPDDCHASTPGLLDKADAFQLSHPEINLPAYCLPGGNNLVLEVNGIDTTVEETGIVLTLLPNMTIRCCIPTPQIPTFSISEQLWLFNQIVMPSIATWASQANHLIHNLPINIMDLQTEFYLKVLEFWCRVKSFEHGHWRYAESSEHLHWRYEEPAKVTELLETTHLYLFCLPNSKDNIHWSRDEEGRHVIEDSLIREAFGITVSCYWHYHTHVFRMPPQCYEILRTIHEGCGFDPYSTQIAEYLRLPLLVADGGHSGLEEYIGDAEYTSESESGDSDYVSATEDA
ncbi:hypothetical protein C8J56DRAFT_82990 [Mycena floridula]|nr:hypothetical protein C8J56DRAFT_82990 [Mycena floridula]